MFTVMNHVVISAGGGFSPCKLFGKDASLMEFTIGSARQSMESRGDHEMIARFLFDGG